MCTGTPSRSRSRLQGDGSPLLVCKGALEEMLPLCHALEQGGQLAPLDDRSATLGQPPEWGLAHENT
jgi:magnesium-transporting ATPase (P-type)